MTDAVRSRARVLWNPGGVSRTGRDSTTLSDCKTSVRSPRMNSPVLVGGGTIVSPTRTGSQEISSPSGTIGPVEVRKAQPFHTFIN